MYTQDYNECIKYWKLLQMFFLFDYSNSGVTASFGEMLLLIAIHFHSGQLTAVGELVCATLGMRVPVRPNGLARIKQAFTQEIFTEQVQNNIVLITYFQ